MTTWTDDELGELLRETFHDHEDPHDADDAVRIARPLTYPVRRRGVLPGLAAVAAGIVVIGGLAGLATYASHHPSGSSNAAASGAAVGAGPGHIGSHRPAGSDVTGTPTGARIRTMTSYGALPDGTPPPRPTTTSIGDAGRLRDLVQLVNGLRGAAPLPHACPPTTLEPGYTTLVLRTSDGAWRFTVSDDCAGMLSVGHDGREIGALDATGFRRHVRAIVEEPPA